MSKNAFRRWMRASTIAVAAMLVSACGGGGNDNSDPPPSNSTPAATQTGTVKGQAVAADTGAPINNATVSIGDAQVRTAADGSFTLEGVVAADRSLVKFASANHGDTTSVVKVVANQTTFVRGVLSPVAVTTSVNPAQVNTVSVPNSPGRVTLPANGLVDAQTNAPVTGPVTVALTPIDPARNPASMPGDYTNTAGAPIESYGALQVNLRDENGRRVNLGANKTATIRIPLSSRAPNPPATIPLFYFDDASGRWVEEGSAALAGTAPNQYYEGSVKHFTVWNADKVVDTIYVNGCLQSSNGQRLSGEVVGSEGVDYIGRAGAITDAEGRFRVAIRRNGVARVFATSLDGLRESNVVKVGPSATDITLPDCLTSSAAVARAPVIVSPPVNTTVEVGQTAFLYVAAAGSQPLRYQWKRGDQDIPNANLPYLALYNLQLADSGATFRVVVTNAAGSVTSDPATVTVLPPLSGRSEQERLVRLAFLAFDFYALGASPLELIDDNDAFRSAGSICSPGSVTSTFDGAALPAPGTLIPGGSHTLAATFNQCVTNSMRYDGASSLQYNVPDFSVGNGSAVATLTNMRLTDPTDATPTYDATGNGVVNATFASATNGDLVTEDITITPTANARLQNNLDGLQATVVSGSLAFRSVYTVTDIVRQIRNTANAFTFTVNGATLVANGSLQWDFDTQGRFSSGSGQIAVTRNGQPIGRIFINNQGAMQIDVDGTVVPFYSLAMNTRAASTVMRVRVPARNATVQ
ncbi:MAG TPA: hypothetical protein VFS42_09645 [Burkholderiaceae bacterium]|nr:hypothetical protein [Burkholderiaceae bacterium]